MQQRVPRPASAMVKRRGDDSITREQSSITATRAGEHGTVLVVADIDVPGLGERERDGRIGG